MGLGGVVKALSPLGMLSSFMGKADKPKATQAAAPSSTAAPAPNADQVAAQNEQVRRSAIISANAGQPSDNPLGVKGQATVTRRTLLGA